VVCGYASLDLVWRAGGRPAPDRTVLLEGQVVPEPTFGGCAPNVALQLAARGCSVGLVSWLGDDEAGRRYLARLAAAGVDLAGVVVGRGRPSPRTLLIYDPDGGCTCCFHPSGAREQGLPEAARRRIATARAVAVTVGPCAVTKEVLATIPPRAMLAWNVKADPDAFPRDLRVRLLATADLVCLSRGELPFLAEVLVGSGGDPVRRLAETFGTTIAVTAAAEPVRVAWPGGQAQVPVWDVTAADPTGAGDAFFAGCLAACLVGADPVAAAREGAATALRFLEARG